MPTPSAQWLFMQINNVMERVNFSICLHINEIFICNNYGSVVPECIPENFNKTYNLHISKHCILVLSIVC